jgi:nucleoside-diphosphate-sugar epimerase
MISVIIKKEFIMRVFVTGATGFVGSAIVKELLAAGHQVLGLARSDASAATLTKVGAEVHRGTLEDLDGLRKAASASDGVIHTAFIHDFSNIAASGVVDFHAIEAMGDALAGSNKPLVTTSGAALVAPGRLATEDMHSDPNSPIRHRHASDEATIALASRGVRSALLRLPPTVHGDGDHGFVPMLIQIAREKGASVYQGDGENRWPAVHRLDAAKLYRLILEKGAAGKHYHAIAEQGVPTRQIAEMIGRRLNLPVVSKSGEQYAEHMGWLGNFFAIDCPCSSEKTRAELGWQPTHRNLIDDLEHGTYFEA